MCEGWYITGCTITVTKELKSLHDAVIVDYGNWQNCFHESAHFESSDMASCSIPEASIPCVVLRFLTLAQRPSQHQPRLYIHTNQYLGLSA
jgi:hypothetical protein